MKVALYVLFSGMVLCSCCSVKKDMIANSIMGTIIHSTEELDCNYTIRVTNDTNEVVFYDPINLEEGLMKDNLKVAFTFRPLKMKNRCDKANPISITHIVKQ